MLQVKLFQNVESLPEFETGKFVVFMTEEFLGGLDEIRNKFKTRHFYGMVVPYLIIDKNLIPQGIAVLILKREKSFAEMLNMENPVFEQKLKDCLKQVKTKFLFVDGLSPFMESFVENLNTVAGDYRVMGTGIGNKRLTHEPCIFDKNDIYKDHALVIGTDLKIDVGVYHGWKPIYGPLVVTKSEKNVVYEIN